MLAARTHPANGDQNAGPRGARAKSVDQPTIQCGFEQNTEHAIANLGNAQENR